jgi:hypothetical protein
MKELEAALKALKPLRQPGGELPQHYQHKVEMTCRQLEKLQEELRRREEFLSSVRLRRRQPQATLE